MAFMGQLVDAHFGCRIGDLPECATPRIVTAGLFVTIWLRPCVLCEPNGCNHVSFASRLVATVRHFVNRLIATVRPL